MGKINLLEDDLPGYGFIYSGHELAVIYKKKAKLREVVPDVVPLPKGVNKKQLKPKVVK